MADMPSQLRLDTERKNYQDFKGIRGIGPAIEERFHASGITTYRQLATSSLDELAAILSSLRGMTADRIAELDWIGQARRLDAGLDGAEDEEGSAVGSRLHYATYTIELLTDEEGLVRRTRILHVQNQAENTWVGWDAGRLNDFIVESAGLRERIPTEVGLSGMEGDKPAQKVSEPEVPERTGERRGIPLGNLEVLSVGGERSGLFLAREQPFYVQVTFDLPESVPLLDAKISSLVKVYARKLSTGTFLSIGEARRSNLLSEHNILQVRGQGLPPGTYRLEANLVLTRAGYPQQGEELATYYEGPVIHVY